MEKREVLESIDQATLTAADRSLYEALKEDVGPPIVPPQMSFSTIRSQLVFVHGTPVDVGEGLEQPGEAIGRSDAKNQFVADQLSLIRDPSGSDENNFGCALLWLDDQSGWLRGQEALKRAEEKLGKAKDGQRLGVAKGNRRLVERALLLGAIGVKG